MLKSFIFFTLWTCLANVTEELTATLCPCSCPDAGRERSQSADPLPLPRPEGGEGCGPHDGRDGPQVYSESFIFLYLSVVSPGCTPHPEKLSLHMGHISFSWETVWRPIIAHIFGITCSAITVHVGGLFIVHLLFVMYTLSDLDEHSGLCV